MSESENHFYLMVMLLLLFATVSFFPVFLRRRFFSFPFRDEMMQ
jgi:hypothetical protein